MSKYQQAQDELRRLERMVDAQRERIRVMEEQANAWPPAPPLVLPAGPVRRVYVHRTRARNLEPPIVVEAMATHESFYVTNVKWSDPQHLSNTEFKWSGNNVDSPALWVETDAELELTL